MKNTNSNTKYKVDLKQLRRQVNAEMSIGQWKSGYNEGMTLRLLDDLELMMMENDKMVTSTKWLMKHKLSEKNIHDFKQRYPEFKERYETLMHYLGCRMHEESFWKKGDFNAARFVLPNYSSTFKQLNDEWKSRPDDDKKIPPVIIVNAAEIPSVIEPRKTNMYNQEQRDKEEEQ